MAYTTEECPHCCEILPLETKLESLKRQAQSFRRRNMHQEIELCVLAYKDLEEQYHHLERLHPRCDACGILAGHGHLTERLTEKVVGRKVLWLCDACFSAMRDEEMAAAPAL